MICPLCKKEEMTDEEATELGCCPKCHAENLGIEVEGVE